MLLLPVHICIYNSYNAFNQDSIQRTIQMIKLSLKVKLIYYQK